MPYFHAGEVAVQARAGTVNVADQLAGLGLGHAVSEDAALLFSRLPFVAISSVGAPGEVWVSFAFGAPGVVRVETPTRLQLVHDSAVHPEDPLRDAWKSEGEVSVLAIDMERRVRYRTTGILGDGLAIRIKEAFPNCPKYIQRRVLEEPVAGVAPVSAAAKTVSRSALSAHDEKLITSSDGIFLGTFNPDTGADVNYRGGRPGFVRVLGPDKIMWPEYRGNGMFQSSGNIEADPRAGLSFLDFNTGDVLQLTGTAVNDWDHDSVFDGASRLIRFHIAKVRRTDGMTSLRWDLKDYSPYVPPVSSPASRKTDSAPNGLKAETNSSATTPHSIYPQRVVLAKIVQDTELVKTFRFLTRNGNVQFLPGQYATFQFENIDALDGGKPVVRTWTLSECAISTRGDVTLEVSVKRDPNGLVSRWLHDSAELGLEVTLLGIDGDMTPVTKLASGGYDAPPKILLISGGIGITPNVAILRGLAVYDQFPSIVFIHQEHSESLLPFQSELRRRDRELENVRLINMISGCSEEETLSDPANRCGRVNEELLKAEVPDLQSRVVYLCGPVGFMSSVRKALSSLGVDASNVHTENFDF